MWYSPLRGDVHYNDVITRTMVSQITRVLIVYSTICWGPDKRKYQSSASLASVRGNHQLSVNSPHKGPVTRKWAYLMTSSCLLVTPANYEGCYMTVLGCEFRYLHALLHEYFHPAVWNRRPWMAAMTYPSTCAENPHIRTGRMIFRIVAPCVARYMWEERNNRLIGSRCYPICDLILWFNNKSWHIFHCRVHLVYLLHINFPPSG